MDELFVVEFFDSENLDVSFGIIKIYESGEFFLARIRENKDTVLKFAKANLFQMITENIAEPTGFFRDIKYDDSPESIPLLWFLYFHFLAEYV